MNTEALSHYACCQIDFGISNFHHDQAVADPAPSTKSKPDLGLDHSRPLDVHRWSDHPEADEFVDHIFARLKQAKGTKIERKHLKVVLLDLYVAWLEDPALKIAVKMSPNEFKAKGTRYNALRISRKTIDVVKWLAWAGLIEIAIGFYDRSTKEGRLTRIWPTDELIEHFEEARLSIYHLGRTPFEEVIILRDTEGNKLGYDDSSEIMMMRQALAEYNEFIGQQFIDIRSLEHPWIDLKNGKRLYIGPQYQQTKRVFNRSSFEKGGRFYSPWWQGCPKEWRKQIHINDSPTVELDFRSLHIALLYARRGVDYYGMAESDAYLVDLPEFLRTPEQTRRYCKILMLTAINADSDKDAYKAFRSRMITDDDALGASLINQQLSVLLEDLRRKHPLIADDLGSDAGIDLMNMDSRITEAIIRNLTAKNIPVLTIHDSYIVQDIHEHVLEEAMYHVYEQVTGFNRIRTETSKNESMPTSYITIGYIKRLSEWINHQGTIQSE